MTNPPTQSRPRVTVEPPSPGELDAFWSRTIGESRRRPLDAKVTDLTFKQPYYEYRVEYVSLDGVPVRGCLAIPSDRSAKKRGTRWPVVVQAPGYSGQAWMFMLGEACRGYAIFNIYPRGQGESAELWQVTPGAYQAWVNHGKHDLEKFYYRGAYIDLLRGVDYLVTRDDIDPDAIGVMGASQGGLFALGLGAIDSRIAAVVASEPALCDFQHSAAQANSDESRDAAFLRVWQYFDPANLAPRIAAPTLLSAGGLDATCPPPTIAAVFDRLPGIKALAHYPELPHSDEISFTRMGWEWLDRYLLR